jgi:hypothetical protein
MRVRLRLELVSKKLAIGLVAAGGRFFKTPFLCGRNQAGKLGFAWGL